MEIEEDEGSTQYGSPMNETNVETYMENVKEDIMKKNENENSKWDTVRETFSDISKRDHLSINIDKEKGNG